MGREVELLNYREGQILGQEMFDELTKEANGKIRFGGLRNMSGWASVAPDEARAWLEELPDGSVKSRLRTAWFGGLVADSPERATELFASLPAESLGESLDQLYASLHRFEGMDSVVGWFMDTAVEEGELRDIRQMVSHTVRQSTLSTINDLGDWLGENADHPLYDMTTRYFVEQAAQEDPEAASEWAETISDPALAEEVSRFLIE